VTVLVGVRCSDGVVIGADGIATSSMGAAPLIHLEADPKIRLFSDTVIMATTGSVGYAQPRRYEC
jgi:20S proteasome alpha/beta subunit